MKTASQISRTDYSHTDQEQLDVEIKVVIADDEPLARQLLIGLAKSHECLRVVGVADNGIVAQRVIHESKPDLVFLDVNMPKMTGIEVAESLSTDVAQPGVVFVTAFSQFATRAFDLDALDYLVKPVSIDRFARTIERARKAIMARRVQELGKKIAEVSTDDQLEDVAKSPSLVIKQRDELIRLAENDIYWLEAASQYVNVHTRDDRYVVAEPMKHYFAKIQSTHFKRVHRSAVVNTNRVRRILRKPNGVHELELTNGAGVPLSRSRKKLLQELLDAASTNWRG